MTDKELERLDQIIKEAEKKKADLLAKKDSDDIFEQTIKAAEDVSDSEETFEDSDQPEEPDKRVGNVKAQFKGRVLSRGPKGIRLELDTRGCRYNPETTLAPRILISINGERDPSNTEFPFEDSLKPGFDYIIICDINIGGDKKFYKPVIKYGLSRFSIVVDDV